MCVFQTCKGGMPHYTGQTTGLTCTLQKANALRPRPSPDIMITLVYYAALFTQTSFIGVSWHLAAAYHWPMLGTE